MQVRTAKEWGLTPSAFRRLDYVDRMEMIAETVIGSKIAAYDHYLADKRAKQRARHTGK
jgi:hypothetical protein